MVTALRNGEGDDLTATRHFTFDLAGALTEQLEAALPDLTPVLLATSVLEQVDDVPGVYQLYLNGDLVYVGKADESLRARLLKHHRKISGRRNIAVADMSFTGLYLEGTWIPVGPEQMLVNHMAAQGVKPPWNTNGFGINDPGKERDTTRFKPDHFDVKYPADLGFVIDDLEQGSHAVNEILPDLKHALPYVFRYENQWARHPDYLTSQVTIGWSPLTAEQAFEALIHALPPGWQITALPGYVIMYKKIREYQSAQRIFTAEI